MSFLIWSLALCWLGGGVCEAEFRNGNLGAEASQGNGSFQDPRPRPCPLLSPLSAQRLLWSWGQVPLGPHEEPYGPQAGVPGSARGLVFLPSSGSASLQDAPCPPFLRPPPPSLATASSTNSSNTTGIEFPAPQDMQFPASVPSLMLFLRTGMPFPAPPALSAWQTLVHSSQSPSTAPSSGPLLREDNPMLPHTHTHTLPPAPGYLRSL